MKNILVVFFMIISVVKGQNLVQNPDFEDTLTCVQYTQLGGTYFMFCYPWFTAYASPDYFNCNLPINYCGAIGACPTTSVYGTKYPLNGVGMAGFAPFTINMNGYKEIIGEGLPNSLLQNHLYYIEFYVSPANNCEYVTDDIGALFSVDSLSMDTFQTFTVIPQVANAQGNILNDTASWTKISGYYNASGGESYLYIGNFKSDTNTTIDSISGAFWNFSYYFLDDVSLIDCTAAGINETEIENLIQLYPNPAKEKIIIIAPQNYFIEQIEILNPTGELKLHQKIPKKLLNFEMDVGDVPKGVYIIKIKTSKCFAFKKLIKY